MRRHAIPELMDRASAEPARVSESLGDLATLNRYLGGTATILHQLERLLGGRHESRLRVLDVAAGGADILLTLERAYYRRGISLVAVALDLGRFVVKVADDATRGTRSISVVRGDARRLPFRDRCFHVAISSTFLHHLEPADAVVTLREMARVSECGIIVSDLRRSTFGYLAAAVLGCTLWRHHPYTRHDATASMRSAYSLAEAQELADRTKLAAVVEAQPLFRWALSWRRAV